MEMLVDDGDSAEQGACQYGNQRRHDQFHDDLHEPRQVQGPTHGTYPSSRVCATGSSAPLQLCLGAARRSCMLALTGRSEMQGIPWFVFVMVPLVVGLMIFQRRRLSSALAANTDKTLGALAGRMGLSVTEGDPSLNLLYFQ